MTKRIKNPYVASHSKYGRCWTVCRRWMLLDKLKFTHLCDAKDQATARLIARALNAYTEPKDAQQEVSPDPGSPQSSLPLSGGSVGAGGDRGMQGRG